MKIFSKYKIRLSTVIIYSIFCGYITPFWTILIPKAATQLSAKIYLILIAGIYFSFPYFKELIAYPIHNYISYILRQKTIEKAHTLSIETVSAGGTVTSLQRTTAGKLLIKTLSESLKHITGIFNSLFLLYKNNQKTAYLNLIIILFYLCTLYFSNKKYQQLKAKAWQETEDAGDIQAKSINQTIAIRQNLITKEESEKALEKEYKAWANYYAKSNILFIAVSMFSIAIVGSSFFFKCSSVLMFLSWQMANNIKTLTLDLKLLFATWADLKIFLSPNTINSNILKYASYIKIENVIIEKKANLEQEAIQLGPFNFEWHEKVIGITGKNGSGKTQLALSIANLVQYSGVIYTPNNIYISLKEEAKLTKKFSMGQNAMALFEKALIGNAQLIIIDELLDILSTQNFEIAAKLIQSSNKKFIIISHSKNILKIANKVVKIK